MARKKDKEQNVRKISVIGNYSLGVTLPRNALNSLGWKNKQKVVVKRVSRGIMITDWKTPKKKK
jgi:antitoxin component of MazEF toxin-antitoxin module